MKSLGTRLVLVITLVASLLVVSTTAAGAGDHDHATFVVTFTNLTDGQPMTPPVVAIHDRGEQIWRPGGGASDGVEAIAEGGDNGPLLAALAESDDVHDFGVAGTGPFGPNGSVSVTLRTEEDRARLSSINMLVCTNDGFTGLNSVRLPRHSRTLRAVAWDAGTEMNTNLAGDVPGAPPCAQLEPGGGGNQDELAENRRIRRHRGLEGAGTLDFERKQRVVEITIERVPDVATYNIAFTNDTAGQPMTPPVVAIHDDDIELFDRGEPASAELEAIAEGGDNGPLVALLDSLGDVSAAGVAGTGPFGPGETVDVTLSTDDDDHVLSSVNMLVCTNDGFTGLNQVELPEHGSVRFHAIAYDAGTEINTNQAGDVPGAPPCAALTAGGGGDQDELTEGGSVRRHEGLSGFGPLDFERRAPVITVTVTKVG